MEKQYAARAWAALDRHGFRFTHSLGQNFLLNDELLGEIVERAGVDRGDNVLEIGPGAGVMTAIMAGRGARVLAVELDRSLEGVLKDVLAGLEGATVHFADALKCDLPALTREAFGGEAFRVVANLPYYITSDALTMLVKSQMPIRSIAVLVQKEAAERILSVPGEKSYCQLSAVIRYFGQARMLGELPPEAFTPKPHVVSAMLRIDPYEKKPCRAQDEALFLRVIASAFAMRRKTLANNLSQSFGITKEKAASILEKCGLNVQIRGEAVELEGLCDIADKLRQELK